MRPRGPRDGKSREDPLAACALRADPAGARGLAGPPDIRRRAHARHDPRRAGPARPARRPRDLLRRRAVDPERARRARADRRAGARPRKPLVQPPSRALPVLRRLREGPRAVPGRDRAADGDAAAFPPASARRHHLRDDLRPAPPGAHERPLDPLLGGLAVHLRRAGSSLRGAHGAGDPGLRHPPVPRREADDRRRPWRASLPSPGPATTSRSSSA